MALDFLGLLEWYFFFDAPTQARREREGERERKEKRERIMKEYEHQEKQTKKGEGAREKVLSGQETPNSAQQGF